MLSRVKAQKDCKGSFGNHVTIRKNIYKPPHKLNYVQREKEMGIRIVEGSWRTQASIGTMSHRHKPNRLAQD